MFGPFYRFMEHPTQRNLSRTKTRIMGSLSSLVYKVPSSWPVWMVPSVQKRQEIDMSPVSALPTYVYELRRCVKK